MDRKRRSGSERTTGREKNVAGIEERCRPQEVDRTISPVSWLHHIAERFTSPRVRYPLVPKNDRVTKKGGHAYGATDATPGHLKTTQVVEGDLDERRGKQTTDANVG